MIAQSAIDLIVAAEVSSRAVYERKYTHPEWPGEASGITIAIGYDVGYAAPDKLRRDWKARIPDEMIDVLVPCCGKTGEAAHLLLPEVRSRVTVPWAPAIEVFLNADLPEYTAKVCAAVPGADKLSPECLGALVSLAYNRGTGGFNDARPRFDEMRAIRRMIEQGKLEGVSDQFRLMKRLWPNSRGLRERRDAEAALWDRGLKSPAPVPTAPHAPENPPPLVTPKAPGKGAAGTAGGSIVATGGAAAQAHKSGANPKIVAAIVIIGLAVIIVGWIAYRMWRAQPVTARAKG